MVSLLLMMQLIYMIIVSNVQNMQLIYMIIVAGILRLLYNQEARCEIFDRSARKEVASETKKRNAQKCWWHSFLEPGQSRVAQG
jgi:hypothetical protein